MRLASLCSGYGGLDLAVADVIGPVEVAWFAEIEPRAAAVFAHHHPSVPNLGDLTAITDPPPVDIVTGGFPCQPVSSAGARKGTDDDRWLFDDICTLVGRMDPRPRLLVFENVAGLLTANDGDAMARVVHGLARLGYVGSWRAVRASDVGACHRRERIFIAAADATVASGEARVGRREPTQPVVGRRAAADPVRAGAGWDRGALPRTPTGPRRPRADVYAAVDAGATPTDATDIGCERQRDTRDGWPGPADHRFGAYQPAVDRWAAMLGRPAPAPVDDRGRLSPTFVEWMMGLPAGWVTDVELNRSHALRILGNGVVPQQAAHALRLLLKRQEVAA